jgi:glutathione-regulated potassium-efflux system ancillary protein KefC
VKDPPRKPARPKATRAARDAHTSRHRPKGERDLGPLRAQPLLHGRADLGVRVGEQRRDLRQGLLSFAQGEGGAVSQRGIGVVEEAHQNVGAPGRADPSEDAQATKLPPLRDRRVVALVHEARRELLDHRLAEARERVFGRLRPHPILGTKRLDEHGHGEQARFGRAPAEAECDLEAHVGLRVMERPNERQVRLFAAEVREQRRRGGSPGDEERSFVPGLCVRSRERAHEVRHPDGPQAPQRLGGRLAREAVEEAANEERRGARLTETPERTDTARVGMNGERPKERVRRTRIAGSAEEIRDSVHDGAFGLVQDRREHARGAVFERSDERERRTRPTDGGERVGREAARLVHRLRPPSEQRFERGDRRLPRGYDRSDRIRALPQVMEAQDELFHRWIPRGHACHAIAHPSIIGTIDGDGVPPLAERLMTPTAQRGGNVVEKRPTREVGFSFRRTAMTEVWAQAALWLGLALVATLLSIWFRVATALSEIVVGTVAQLVIGAIAGMTVLEAGEPWIKFLSGTGAIVLTFLAGAELDPVVFRAKWKEATVIGLVGFFAPFLGCTAIAHWALGWDWMSSWLAGVALSTTSVAVVYAVMLELGFNRTDFGKAVLAACFINDLGTVIALGVIFAPFSLRTLLFVGVSLAIFVVLPWLTPRFFRRYGNRPSELEAKYLLLLLFGFGALATWAGSEAVLPAYLVGMVLAGTVGKDHELIRRLRTLTFGLLTPFYFISAGSYISVPALVAAPAAFLVLLLAKVVSKSAGIYPTTRAFKYPFREGVYTTLLMSTGLTFGTISALFGLTHGVIDQDKYSFLVAAVVASAVIPTIVANAFFLPRHLLTQATPIEVAPKREALPDERGSGSE